MSEKDVAKGRELLDQVERQILGRKIVKMRLEIDGYSTEEEEYDERSYLDSGSGVVFPERPVTEAELGYLAGLVDVAGEVVVKRRRISPNLQKQSGVDKAPRFVMVCTVTHSNKNAMSWIRETFGGVLFVNKEFRLGNARAIIDWEIRGRNASTLLGRLLPYLRVKLTEASMALELQRPLIRNAGWDGTGNTPEEILYREMLFSALSSINQGIGMLVEQQALEAIPAFNQGS